VLYHDSKIVANRIGNAQHTYGGFCRLSPVPISLFKDHRHARKMNTKNPLLYGSGLRLFIETKKKKKIRFFENLFLLKRKR
jgi:hypothetical protein